MIKVDPQRGIISVPGASGDVELPFASAEAFRVISELWLRVGWDTKYVYGFTWMGRPIIQLPEDMVRIQEVIWRLKPDLIIETGVAHGGSLIFYAGLCKAIGAGRVVGVDIEIRPHNRAAIEAHPLYELITLIEGSSIAPDTVAAVKQHVRPGMTVLVMLDSNHTKDHVRAELEAYAPLVSVGSYIVAADGIMAQVAGAPRTRPDWTWNNPAAAAEEFVASNPRYVIERPAFLFNEGVVDTFTTYWPKGYVRRIS
jgi:cephalosporin hydroxylase